MERYDIAIIGTGPAGVSAAITAKVRGKRLILFGAKAMSDKVEKAHSILNYPGLPNVTGAQLAQAFSNHLESMDIPITEKQVTAVYAMGDYFAIQTPEEMIESRTVILAAGVVTAKALPGENEFLGRGVSYCATCDAHFYRGKTVAVLGYSAQSCQEADFLAETCEKVLYFPAAPHEVQVGEGVEVIREKPTAILGDRQARILETNSQKQYAVDGIFVLRAAVAPEKLVPGIAVEENHVRVDLQMRTNLPGCFACGDVTGPPYQYIKAAGQGNVAALSAAAYLAEQKKKE